MLRPSATMTEAEEKSLDFRLLEGFFLCMVVAVAVHLFFKVGTQGEAIIACAAAVVGIFLSIKNRVKHGWRWPGTGIRDVLWAFAVALLLAFFVGAALPGHSPLEPRLFPWCAIGVSWLLFAVLNGLHIVCQSEEEFRLQCGPATKATPVLPAPRPPRTWQSIVTNAFQVYFLLIWIAGVGFFWRFNAVFHHGSPVATAAQTEQLSNHGQIVYISLQDWQQVHLLERVMMLGIPSVFVIGGFLHFVARVKVFSRTAD